MVTHPGSGTFFSWRRTLPTCRARRGCSVSVAIVFYLVTVARGIPPPSSTISRDHERALVPGAPTLRQCRVTHRDV